MPTRAVRSQLTHSLSVCPSNLRCSNPRCCGEQATLPHPQPSAYFRTGQRSSGSGPVLVPTPAIRTDAGAPCGGGRRLRAHNSAFARHCRDALFQVESQTLRPHLLYNTEPGSREEGECGFARRGRVLLGARSAEALRRTLLVVLLVFVLVVSAWELRLAQLGVRLLQVQLVLLDLLPAPPRVATAQAQASCARRHRPRTTRASVEGRETRADEAGRRSSTDTAKRVGCSG